MLSSSFATSATVRPIGPGVSWKCTSGEKPARLISPVVTRRPKRLLKDAGIRMDPPVSSPIPTSPKLAATPAPVPALDPPDWRPGLARGAIGILGVVGHRRGGEPASREVAHGPLREDDRAGVLEPCDHCR